MYTIINQLSLSLSLPSFIIERHRLSLLLSLSLVTNMSEDKEHRTDDDYSHLGAESPPPMPPVRTGATFDSASGVNISLFACRANYRVIGLLTLLLD